MNEEWSDEALIAAVAAYREMEQRESRNERYSKRGLYRALAKKFGRTEKAFEYRMQNISAVLAAYDRPWVPGLKPAANVGSNVEPRIAAILGLTPSVELSPHAGGYRSKLPAMRNWLIHIAKGGAPVTYGDMMKAFQVDRFSLRHAMDHLGHESRNLEEPILTALIVNKRTRRCSDGLAKEFGVLDDRAERSRLYAYWAGSNGSAKAVKAKKESLKTRARRFAQVEVRTEQPAFRSAVFLAFRGKCAISGCSIDRALDAAHLQGRDWRLGHNSAGDGILLRKDLHALYDAGLLKIREDRTLELSPEIASYYMDLAGTRVTHRRLK